MKTDIKYIWIVESENQGTDRNSASGRKSQTFYSTKEKAETHLEWLKQCAINNDAKEIFNEEDHIEYRLRNQEIWVCEIKRAVMDFDDIMFD